jgi:ribosomal-protein-alanine N-acetyltransferase
MFPKLSSTHFLLSQIVPSDQQFIFSGLSDPNVIRYYGVSYNSYDSTSAQMEFYDQLLREGRGIWWKIVSKKTDEHCGAIGFNNYQPKHRKAEIGYWLLPEFWKKGIINEVLPIMIRYMQSTLHIHRIEALVEEGNESSVRSIIRAGFSYEGCMRDFEIKNGRFISLKIYSLIMADGA